MSIAVLTRNEHCPPHVHAGTNEWDARYEFSFWHNGVRLWDVSPAWQSHSAKLLEELRQVILAPANLHKARVLWWKSRRTVCLDNQYWDLAANEIAAPGSPRSRKLKSIRTAVYKPESNTLELGLVGLDEVLEIEL